MHRTLDAERVGFLGVNQIAQNATGVVTRVGRFARTMQPGLNFYIPILEKVHQVSNRLGEMSLALSVMTADSAFVELKMAVQLRVVPEASGSDAKRLARPTRSSSSTTRSARSARTSTTPSARTCRGTH